MVFRISPKIAALIHACPAPRKSSNFEEQYKKLLEKGFKDVTEDFPVSCLIDNNKPISVYVDWGCAVVAPLSTLIATDGLNGCAALKIVDRKSNLQYLIHVFRNDTITSSMEHSLLKAQKIGINFSESEIEIMPGLIISTGAAPRILEALNRIDPSLLKKISLIRNLKESYARQGLVMHGGETYRYPDTDMAFDHRYYRCFFDKLTIKANGFVRVL